MGKEGNHVNLAGAGFGVQNMLIHLLVDLSRDTLDTSMHVEYLCV